MGIISRKQLNFMISPYRRFLQKKKNTNILGLKYTRVVCIYVARVFMYITGARKPWERLCFFMANLIFKKYHSIFSTVVNCEPNTPRCYSASCFISRGNISFTAMVAAETRVQLHSEKKMYRSWFLPIYFSDKRIAVFFFIHFVFLYPHMFLFKIPYKRRKFFSEQQGFLYQTLFEITSVSLC